MHKVAERGMGGLKHCLNRQELGDLQLQPIKKYRLIKLTGLKMHLQIGGRILTHISPLQLVTWRKARTAILGSTCVGR